MGSSRHLQSAHELKSYAGQAVLAVEFGRSWSYFEYSSTISCSLTGRLISSRFGSERTLPLSFSRSIESHAGAGYPAAYDENVERLGAERLDGVRASKHLPR